MELRDGAALLQRAGFTQPVADNDSMELAYRSRLALLEDLRAAGETNAILRRNRRAPPRSLFSLALARMPEREGRVPVRLQIAMLTGWAPMG
jgi:NADH dehydrogenase [ubiquinone] 1 alpha subcomplex assembly factor 5